MDLSKSSRRNNPFLNAAHVISGQARDEAHLSSTGPPPSSIPPHLFTQQDFEHTAPPGPPLGQSRADTEIYAPPPGPPPSSSSYEQSPPPYHDWQSVPDTALLPPPPSLGYVYSPTSNADVTDAQRARSWCEQRPLMRPFRPAVAHVDAVQNGDISLERPSGRAGSVSSLGVGHWSISTTADLLDTCFISSLPLFFETVDSPLHTKRSKTVYYEVKIKSLRRQRDGSEGAAALGFCAVPYPPFRMPGWERGSLAVHSDDGHRYVNDNEGGKDFTDPIRAGETVGIGIVFSLPEAAANGRRDNPLNGEVFFTRNGYKQGSWDIYEQVDQSNQLGAFGIDGNYDLFAAVGTYGRVSLDVAFDSRQWLWRP